MANTENGTPGASIQIKRTALQRSDAKINTEGLAYGEPLFFKSDKTLVIGDGETQPSSEEAFKAFDISYLSHFLFENNKDSTSKLCKLNDEDGSALYIQEKSDWGTVTISSSDTFYKIKADGSKSQTAETDTTKVCCLEKSVTGMKSTYIPKVGLSVPNTSLSSSTDIRSMKKAFALVSSVITYDGGIRIYFTKRPSTSITLYIYGG